MIGIQISTRALAGRTQWAALAATVATLALPCQPAAAQEFDCRNAAFTSERTICRSDNLSALDERMSSLYSELVRTYASERQRSGLRAYQHQFLDARDDCGRDTNCIKGAYLDQISVLEGRLEEASQRSER